VPDLHPAGCACEEGEEGHEEGEEEGKEGLIVAFALRLI
jgi:hypothetical protein